MAEQAAPLDASARRLLELLQEPERVDGLVAAIVERAHAIYEADAGHDPIPPEELAVAAVGLTHAAISALLEQRQPSDAELAQAAILGELRARQGVTLETLLRGIRVGAREGLAAMREGAVAAGLDAETTVTLAAALWDWIDDVSVEVADAHRRVELALARRDQQQRATFVHGLVFGTLTPQRLADGVAAFDLRADAEYVVLRVRPTDEHGAEELEQLLIPSTWSAGLAAMVEDDLVAVLPAPPADDVPVAAGLGPPAQLGAMAHSFRLAGQALDTALAFGRVGCQRLEDLSLRSAVLREGDVGDLLAARYLAPLRALGPFGEEILVSLRAYMASGQNVDAAARELIVHPNTLRHRLHRFEEESGADLRDLESLAEIWWALTYDGVLSAK